MGKLSKTTKFKLRIKKPRQLKIDKLFEKMNKDCISCIYDCKNMVENNKCKNKKDSELSLWDIIDLLKEQEVNLLNLCNSYDLKLEVMISMLKAEMILNYKYRTIIMCRLGLIKDEYEINENYRNGEFFDGNIKERKNIDNEDGGDFSE